MNSLSSLPSVKVVIVHEKNVFDEGTASHAVKQCTRWCFNPFPTNDAYTRHGGFILVKVDDENRLAFANTFFNAS